MDTLKRYPIHLYYVILALLFTAMMATSNSIWMAVVTGWVAVSLWLVTFAYWFSIAKIFRKRQDGRIPLFFKWLFVPFLFGASLYNAVARKRDKVPPVQRINDDLMLACRLFPSDIELLKDNGVAAVLDVTAEFDALDVSLLGEDIAYLNIPVLDHTSPTGEQVRQGINWIHGQIHKQRTVVIHCALGRGRSVFMLAAYLLARNPDSSVDEVLRSINDIRATAQLNKRQLKTLENIHNDKLLRLRDKACIIANPVSGGGKWPANQAQIVEELSPYFHLEVKQTSPEVSGEALAKQALAEGAELLIACGGDGTVCEVASVLTGSDTPLAIIPMGTTNALSHVLMGIKSKLIPVSVACQAIIDGHITRIDTARCNDKLMLLLAGIGFEERMIDLADREEKNQLGQLAYIKGLLTAVTENQPRELQVQIDDETAQSLTLTSLVVANSAPVLTLLAQGAGEPDFTDGKLELTWIEHQPNTSHPFVSMAELLISAISGDAVDVLTRHKTAERVQITSQTSFGYVIDGERFETHSLDIRINPASLSVLIPDTYERYTY